MVWQVAFNKAIEQEILKACYPYKASDFVHMAVKRALDKYTHNQVDLSVPTVEKLTREQIMKLTKEA